MTYQEFKDKYNGKYIDYDGAYGYQCWDLAQYYFTEVLNVPDYVLSGCGLVNNMLYPPKRADLDAYFDEVPVTEMNVGDVCIWEYGHIAILDSYDGYRCWYFSQNPNPCQLMTIDVEGMHAFRRKKETPTPPPSPTPVITPNVDINDKVDQIEVIVPELRVRTDCSLQAEILGYANIGYYNYKNIVENDGYKWYQISDNNWIASSDEWTIIHPKKEDEYISFKVLEKDGNYCKIDINNIFVKKD